MLGPGGKFWKKKEKNIYGEKQPAVAPFDEYIDKPVSGQPIWLTPSIREQNNHPKQNA